MSKGLYQDGLFRPDQEVTVVPRVKYPFALNPVSDVYSKVYERDYNVLPTVFTPKIANRTSWTNILTYSQDTTNAAWTKTAVTPTISGTAPDGNATLNKWLETAANSEHSATQAATVTAASTFFGLFAAAGLGRNWLKLTFTDSTSAVFSAFFDVSTGNLGTVSGSVTTKILPMGNGQYLVGFLCTPASGAGTLKVGISTDGATVSYAGDTAKGVYVWGAQVVTASAVPPYIGTTSASRTISSPNVDSVDATNGDPLAYLVGESEPNNITSLVASLTRKYARIPNQQTVYTTINLSKPGASSGSPAYGTGGTIANATPFTLDLLVQYPPMYIIGTSPYYYFAAGINAVFGPISTAFTSANSGSDTRLTFTGAHGIAGTETLMVKNASISAFSYVLPAQYAVINATTIDILGHNYGANILTCAKYYRAYSPGSGRVTCQLVSNYYLPGVTTSITTAADIPVPVALNNDTDFLLAVINNLSGYVSYDSQAMGSWQGGPIYVVTKSLINFASL
jgi:hypothetical protein